MTGTGRIGTVLIGRNEGDRLVRALDAARAEIAGPIVYVDSGSTDGSLAAAEAAGAEIVLLDTSDGFTAARARNAGIEALKTGTAPDLVQFIDGDCALDAGW
ncbi:MAG: glycosyltransferase family A protein, partial [Planctomycetota bacterium]